MSWTHTKEGVDNYVRDERGEAIMCDTSYYPWIDITDEQWKLVAAAPDLLEALKDCINAMTMQNYRINENLIERCKIVASKAEGAAR